MKILTPSVFKSVRKINIRRRILDTGVTLQSEVGSGVGPREGSSVGPGEGEGYRGWVRCWSWIRIRGRCSRIRGGASRCGA